MKKNSLTRNQKKLIDGLIKADVNKHVAKVFAYLLGNDEVKSIDIQKATGLKQPEVSIAIRKLEDRGWVTKRTINLGKSGRPFYEYSLNMELDDIIAEIEGLEKEKIKEIEDNLKDIKEYANAI